MLIHVFDTLPLGFPHKRNTQEFVSNLPYPARPSLNVNLGESQAIKGGEDVQVGERLIDQATDYSGHQSWRTFH